MTPTVENHEIAWDSNMCTTQSAGTEVRRLMAKAFKSPLTLQQQDSLLEALNKDQKLVYHIGTIVVDSIAYLWNVCLISVYNHSLQVSPQPNCQYW